MSCRNRVLSLLYSYVQSIAVRLSYPTLRPGPSTYQSSPEASFPSWRPAPGSDAEFRYDKIVFGVAERRIPVGVREGEELVLRPWLKGDDRKRDAKFDCWGFDLRVKEKLALFRYLAHVPRIDLQTFR